MDTALFEGTLVESERILYTPPVTPWELGMPEASDLTERKELSKAGSITGVKS